MTNRGEEYQLAAPRTSPLFNPVTKLKSNGNIPKRSMGEVVWTNRHNTPKQKGHQLKTNSVYHLLSLGMTIRQCHHSFV